MKKTLLLLTACLALSGCQIVDQFTGAASVEQKNAADKQLAKIRCMEVCQDAISNEENMNNGPCLNEAVIPGWVCDIAHNPREDVDNEPKNQCGAFRQGLAKHFVELDGNCNLIKAQ